MRLGSSKICCALKQSMGMPKWERVSFAVVLVDSWSLMVGPCLSGAVWGLSGACVFS